MFRKKHRPRHQLFGDLRFARNNWGGGVRSGATSLTLPENKLVRAKSFVLDIACL